MMDHQTTSLIQVAEWLVDPATSRIQRNDESVQLEPRLMELLVYLCKHSNRVVRREELEAQIWENRVSYDALTNAIVKLRKAFGEDHKHPRIIETLSKKGYRIIAPVTFPDSVSPSISLPLNRSGNTNDRQKWWTGKTRRVAVTAFAFVMLATLSSLIYVLQKTSPPEQTPETDDKTIAVLPFENRSPDPAQGYVADGVTDDLITTLAMNPQLRVIARDSTFFYKNQPQDTARIGQLLKAQYIVQGSVSRDKDQLHVNVQVVNVSTQKHLWANHFEGRMLDIFSIEREITRNILSKLNITSSIGEQQDLGTPQTADPIAYDHFLQGRQLFYKYFNREENQRAREHFEKAIEYDPNLAIAYAMTGWTHIFDVMNGWSTQPEISLQNAIDYSNKAIVLQPALPIAYFVSGLAYRQRGEYVKSLVEIEKATQYDPNYANAHVLHATLLYYAGRPREGLERIKKAMQLNPHHPYNYTFHLGQAYYILGRYKDAIKTFKSGIKSNPNSERLHVWLAAACAQQGDKQEAEWAAISVLTINPDFSISRLRDTFPFKDPEDRRHFFEGLHKAGLPE